MTDPRPAKDARPQDGRSEWERRRRLAEVFGDVLPESTSDDRDDATEASRREGRGDAWLREQVPPHHG